MSIHNGSLCDICHELEAKLFVIVALKWPGVPPYRRHVCLHCYGTMTGLPTLNVKEISQQEYNELSETAFTP